MYAYTCRSLRCNSSFGGVLKRLKRPHLKCGRSVSSRRVGSNPTSSAFDVVLMDRDLILHILKTSKNKISACRALGISINGHCYEKLKSIAASVGYCLDYKRPRRYCLQCGMELTAKQSKFCSIQHSVDYHKQSSNSIACCLSCGRPVRRGRKFCSKTCCSLYKKREYYDYYLTHQSLFCTSCANKHMHFVKPFILDEQGNVCAVCGNPPTHNGRPLVFVLDHIDGNAGNNLRNNLRLVCPNCDSQLPTFKSRNRVSARRAHIRKLSIARQIDMD